MYLSFERRLLRVRGKAQRNQGENEGNKADVFHVRRI
jgi:hypothetical protein